MACYSPLLAYRTFDNSIIFNERSGDVVHSLTLPCGQCIGCRLERARQWAMRCVHEASNYQHNSFVTLTYNDDSLPDVASLHYDDFQRFMKRLRKAHKGFHLSPRGDYPIRFYMAGEYGSTKMRPHFHACLFNFDFLDKKVWQKTKSGSLIYRSAELERLWPFGYSSIGELNFQSAGYVARYCMKKVTGDLSTDHYTRCEEITGELIQLRPEFNKMSLKPGIGFDWYQKFKKDVYNFDYVVINGKRCKPPKFYDKKFEAEYPLDFDDIKFDRLLKIKDLDDAYQPDLQSLLDVATHRVSLLKRDLD